MARRNTTAKWIESASRWQVRVKNDDGLWKTFVCAKPGRTGQTECNRKADLWLLKGEQTHGRCGKMISEWLDHVKITTSKSNYIQRESHMRLYVLPVVKDLKLEDTNRATWQKIIDSAYKDGRSKKTLQNLRGTISAFLSYYERSAKIIVPTDAKRNEKKILQPDAVNILMSDDTCVERKKTIREWFINYYRLAVVTGLRPGEVLALEWKHVSGDRILVRGSVNKYGQFTYGKNKNAIREEPMTAIAKSILDDQKAFLKNAGIISNYVFPRENGELPSQTMLLKHWYRYQASHNIERTSLYELRHTFTSVMAGRSGMTLQELRSVMGHSVNMDTLGVYAKDLPDSMKVIRDKTDAAFATVIK
ncbi:MAG: site-specific integrase [Clostridia bacterium]|nr:site-specific integrase [Clostridia bacterium]